MLFIGYGDTDTWQHMGRYDAFLETAHSFDGYLADLWRQVQSTAHYKDKTTLIVSTDHGRGSGPIQWRDHGVDQKGSDAIWIAVIGPDTQPLGERHDFGGSNPIADRVDNRGARGRRLSIVQSESRAAAARRAGRRSLSGM